MTQEVRSEPLGGEKSFQLFLPEEVTDLGKQELNLQSNFGICINLYTSVMVYSLKWYFPIPVARREVKYNV